MLWKRRRRPIFRRNPRGRGRLAVFPRCSLLTYQSRYARRSRLEKQLTDPASAHGRQHKEATMIFPPKGEQDLAQGFNPG
jgi:hypothetical protein